MLTRAQMDPPQPGEISRQPDPLMCVRCGSRRTFARWPTRDSRHYGRVSPRWCRPRVDPCDLCAGDLEAISAEARLSRAQAKAGIAERDRGWRWERTTRQRPAQPLAAFVDRVRAQPEATIGVLAANEDACRDVAGWTPAAGHSIYLAGAPGTGKTVIASALASRLLAGQEGGRRQLTDEEGIARYGPTFWERRKGTSRDSVVTPRAAWQVCLIAESDLFERQRLKWNKDRDPLGQIADKQCLILDDLGECGRDPLHNEKMPHGYREMIQRLIRRRYARGLNCVFTSNVPMEDVRRGGRVVLSGVRAWYGDRVYDRLQEMTRGHVWHMETHSWRR